MWKTLRLCLALLCLAGFVLLFCDLSEQRAWAAHFAWLAKIQLLPALLAGSIACVLAVLAATLAFGRIYCSAACPLGLLQDVLLSLRRKGRFHFLPPHAWLRFGMLALFLAALLLGLPWLVALLEPYSAFGRIAASIGQPLAVLINNAADWLARTGHSYAFAPQRLFSHGAAGLATAIGTLLLLVCLTLAHGRVWCTHICPVGTILGLLSRFALFRPRIHASQCSRCGKCERVCKAGCIDARTSTVDASRCVGCLNCQSVCASGALRFSPGRNEAVREDRRRAMGKAAIGALGLLAASRTALAAGGKRTEAEILAPGYKPRRSTDLPILPAGAQSLRHFATRCTGCQACVAACPSQILATFDQGSGILQPSLSFHHGFCRTACTVCGKVCPTEAILKVTPEEKSAIQIGHAEVDRSLCVVKTDKVACTACQRGCPAGAISLVGEDKLKEPAVNREKCTGCGACEHYCPVRPISAITVLGHAEHRRI